MLHTFNLKICARVTLISDTVHKQTWGKKGFEQKCSETNKACNINILNDRRTKFC